MNDNEAFPSAPSTIISHDGTHVAFFSVGRGPSVIVVPGALSTAATYARFAAALAPRFTVHTLERRGRGLSGPQGEEYSVSKEREDLIAVQRATGAALLVEHSFGGLVALETVRDNSNYSHVALYEPGVSVGGSITVDWIPAYRALLAQGRPLDAFVEFTVGAGPDRARRMPRWLMKLLLPRLIKPDDLRRLLSLLPENLKEHQALAALDDVYDHYRDVSAEVLLIHGGRSGHGWVELATTTLLDVLPRAEIKVFPTLDHFGLDKGAPEEVAAFIGDFFLR